MSKSKLEKRRSYLASLSKESLVCAYTYKGIYWELTKRNMGMRQIGKIIFYIPKNSWYYSFCCTYSDFTPYEEEFRTYNHETNTLEVGYETYNIDIHAALSSTRKVIDNWEKRCIQMEKEDFTLWD